MQNQKPDIETILQDSELAKLELFNTLVKKIKNGESLKKSEWDTFQTLNKLFADQSENGPPQAEPEKIASFNAAAVYLGISKRMVSYYLNKGDLKQNPDGTFDQEMLDNFRGRHKSKKKIKTMTILTLHAGKTLNYGINWLRRKKRKYYSRPLRKPLLSGPKSLRNGQCAWLRLQPG